MKTTKFRGGQLPNGEFTVSLRRYVRAYRRLAHPILKIWPEQGQHGYSYEPGLCIGTIELNSRDSMALYEALTGREYIC